jgi:hypothetical protein
MSKVVPIPCARTNEKVLGRGGDFTIISRRPTTPSYSPSLRACYSFIYLDKKTLREASISDTYI